MFLDPQNQRVLLGVATLAACWAFFHFIVTIFAGLVSEIFAESFDFPASCSFVAFCAVFHSFGVSLMLESYAFFHFYYVGSKC